MFASVFKWCPKLSGTLVIVIMSVVLFSGSEGPVSQVSRVLGSAAVLSEATAATGAAMLDATGWMASSMSTMAVSTVWQTLELSEAAWHGVDIADVNASRCDGQVLVDSAEVLKYWLSSRKLRAAAPCLSSEVQQQMQLAAEHVHPRVPQWDESFQQLDVHGNYSSVQVLASLISTGQIALKYSKVQVDFRASWCNPLWSAFELSLRSEQKQILQQLEEVRRLLPVQSMTFSDEIMGDAAPVPVRWKAFSERALRGSWVHLLLLARAFGLDSQCGCGALAIFFQTMLLVSYLASAKMRSAHFAGCPASELGVRKSFLSKWLLQAQLQLRLQEPKLINLDRSAGDGTILFLMASSCIYKYIVSFKTERGSA